MAVSSSYWPVIWPAPAPAALTLHTGVSTAGATGAPAARRGRVPARLRAAGAGSRSPPIRCSSPRSWSAVSRWISPPTRPPTPHSATWGTWAGPSSPESRTSTCWWARPCAACSASRSRTRSRRRR
ncbi:MAG: hypothetical protein U5L11_03945 [Arhodomonas sp.]|nr:hypothetical protein [Arhodomonas sp.]